MQLVHKICDGYKVATAVSAGSTAVVKSLLDFSSDEKVVECLTT